MENKKQQKEFNYAIRKLFRRWNSKEYPGLVEVDTIKWNETKVNKCTQLYKEILGKCIQQQKQIEW